MEFTNYRQHISDSKHNNFKLFPSCASNNRKLFSIDSKRIVRLSIRNIIWAGFSFEWNYSRMFSNAHGALSSNRK